MSEKGIILCCHFCKQNNEEESVFKSHNLRNTKEVVTCPILANYTCPKCDVKGHTVKYCKNKRKFQILKPFLI